MEDEVSMTLKNCPCCLIKQTTKNAIKKERDEIALYFNCKSCGTTFTLRKKDWKSIREKQIEKDVA